MATSEIEKLERRYAENPHGLTFAPLAEVHRKNGDIPRALELLTAGLELHPNYIPASIVLGRCHQDLSDLPSAEAAFAHVLRLDDENVIALKSLADISERLERYTEAENWLRRLVAVDRSNDDAKEQLQRVQAAKPSGSAPIASAPITSASVPEEAKVAAPAPAPAPALEMIDLSPEPALSEAPPPASPEATPAEPAVARRPEPEPVKTSPKTVEPEPEPVEPEPVMAVDAPASPRDIPLPFIETSAPERAAATSADEVVEAEVRVPDAVAATAEVPNTPESTDEPVQPLPGLISAEFQPPLEATGGLGVETSEEVLLEVSGNSEFSVPDASEYLKSVAARLASPKPPPAVEEPPLEAVAPPPVAAPAELEWITPEPPKADWTPPEPLKRQYLARETNGQSVAAFFRALLSARLSSNDAAGSSISAQNGGGPLGYGEEELPAPPAVPAGEQKGDTAVSFDDFFGSEGDASGPSRQGKSDPGEDDLDQFQSWLQNLKR